MALGHVRYSTTGSSLLMNAQPFRVRYSGKTLAIVLTGMGADGRDGAKLLKQGGSTVWAQDEASSVIYGMPMAVAKAGLSASGTGKLTSNWRWGMASILLGGDVVGRQLAG